MLEKGYSQIWIARKLKVKKQRVNYWAKTPLKTVQNRRRKLDNKYIEEIINLASDQTTSSMSSTKIARIINKKLKEDGLAKSIHNSTVCRILKQKYGKPRKIKRVFFLTKRQKTERVAFCREILKRQISGKQILFTDETKIELGSFINDSIRVSEETKEKLKKGETEAFEKLNRPQRKFEPSIMIGGGISSFGLTNLIIQEGTLNEFAYAQSLYFYKDTVDEIQRKFKCKLYFEQDGARAHTSSSNLKLIEHLFGKERLIQNPPNSPDIAYPIENIWGYLKPKIKKRDPKTLNDLKRITIEEWNNIPKKIIEKCGENYINRLKKVIEINGERLEPFHLREIEKSNKTQEIENEKEPQLLNDNLKIKVVYNDQSLNALRKKQILRLKKEIKITKKEANKKLKEASKKTIRIPGIVLFRKKRKEKIKEKKRADIEEKAREIEKIEKMNIIEYLNYIKQLEKEKKQQDGETDDESTMDDSINTILKIKELNKKKNNGIKYEIEF